MKLIIPLIEMHLLFYLSLFLLPLWQTSAAVQLTHGTLELPTYSFGRSEAVAPLFPSIDNRGLYPYSVLDRDSLSRKPVPVRYESLILENEYLRVTILPELGGRIWSVREKGADREVFYTTSVVKPTLYNQRGGWPAGNLEVYGPYDAHMLTWPGEPWPWAFEQSADGAGSITLSHIDHFFRNKISMTVTLRPGRSFVELTVRLRNNNLLPNRYLLWTNAGVAATEGTRFVYPMTRTIAHVSSEIGTWPMVEGVDLSWYKNNPNMLGVFGLDLYDDFIAAYDYKTDQGVVCYTNRQIARGVKTWTWGTGEAARRQMEHYTDADGPYLEVQSGRFVWDGNYEFIEPGKIDGWTEYWYGTGGLGEISTATRDVAVGFILKDRRLQLSIRATGRFPDARLQLKAGEETLWTARQDLTPDKVFAQSIELRAEAAEKAMSLEVFAANGDRLARYQYRPDGSHPNVVFAADSIPRTFGPIDGLSAEEAFQKGLAHEKFGEMDAARIAYEAALAKDKAYTQPHLRLGAIALDRMQHETAIDHFEKVLARDPRNGDALYFLAVANFEAGNDAESRRYFYRLLPAHANFDQREYGLGLLALREKKWGEAETLFSQAAAASPNQVAIRQALAYTLRKLGREEEAQKQRAAILSLDPTNAFARIEPFFLLTANPNFALLDRACAWHEQGYLELATEYLRLSAWKEAASALSRGVNAVKNKSAIPMLQYYRAYVADHLGDAATVREALAAVRRQPLDLEIFPFRRESFAVLQRMLAIEPKDANAAYLLGDLFFSKSRRAEAQATWRRAIESDPRHFPALRNLGMSLLEAGHKEEALALLNRAVAERPDHLSTILLVADLQPLDSARQTIELALQKQPGHDRLIERLATIETASNRPARALDLLTRHRFEPRHQAYSLLQLYQATQLMLARDQYRSGKTAAAREHARAAQTPPANLGIDDFTALQSPRLLIFEALLQANDAWARAAATPAQATDEEALFRALALQKTGKKQEADAWFEQFRIRNERERQSERATVRAQSFYLAGVYAAFQKQPAAARDYLRQCLAIDRMHLWALQALSWLEAGLLN